MVTLCCLTIIILINDKHNITAYVCISTHPILSSPAATLATKLNFLTSTQAQKIHQWATSKRKAQGLPPGPTASHGDIDNNNDDDEDFPREHKENLSLAATLGVGSLLLFINLSVFGVILLRRLRVTRYNRSPSDGEELFSKVKKRVRIDDHVSKEIVDLYCEQNTLSNDQDDSIDTIISSDERFGGDDDLRFGHHERPLISNLQTPINQHAQKKCLKARFEVPPGQLDIRSSDERRQQANVLRYKSFLGPRGSQSFERQRSENLSSQFNISGSNREVLAQDILMTTLVDSCNPLQTEARSCIRTLERQNHFETDSDEFLVSFSIERPSTPPARQQSNSYKPSSLTKKHYQRANQSETSPEATSTIISCHQHITGDAGPLDSSKELSFARQSSSSERTISAEARQRPTPTPLDKSPYDQMKFPIRQNEFHSSPITSVWDGKAVEISRHVNQPSVSPRGRFFRWNIDLAGDLLIVRWRDGHMDGSSWQRLEKELKLHCGMIFQQHGDGFFQ